MSEAMDSLMCRYERGISKHDCREWETQLEEEEIVRKLSTVTCEKRSKVRRGTKLCNSTEGVFESWTQLYP